MTTHRKVHRPLLVLLAIGLPACHGVPDEPVLTVDSRQALLEIPIPNQATWTWYRPETPANHLEYQFDATVSVPDASCSFGFYLYKRPDGVADSGPLNRLLRLGQKSVWCENSAILGIWVRPELDAAGLLRLRLLDSDAVNMMFADRPDSAHVQVRMPGFAAESTVVPVRYVGR
jgi:hypothetical protein